MRTKENEKIDENNFNAGKIELIFKDIDFGEARLQ